MEDVASTGGERPSWPQRLWRDVRIVVASLALVAAITATSLWVYSYQVYARLSLYPLGSYIAVEIWQGGVRCTLDYHPDPAPDSKEQSAKLTSVPAGDVESALKQQRGASATVFPPGILGFSYRNHYGFQSVTIPNWAAVFAACAIGVAAKPAPRLRFGIRELLTLTTVTGIVAAIIGTLLRNSL